MTKEEYNKKFRELRFELGLIARLFGFSDTTQLFEFADLIKSKQSELEELNNRISGNRCTVTSDTVTRRYVRDIGNELSSSDWITK